MIGWLDCTAGASGDMLLGAVVAAGVPLQTVQEAIDAIGTEPVRLTAHEVQRGGMVATKVDVLVDRPGGGAPAQHRTWQDVRGLLERAPLEAPVRGRALDAFARLAAAEGRVHGVPAEQVHFHEVGALDAIADVVGACAGLHALGLDRLFAGRVALGSGTARAGHGTVPVPAPAVIELLSAAAAPVWSGPAPFEMCTPTGAALLAAHVDAWSGLPPMIVRRTGVGAGGRDPVEVPNVLRLVLGDPAGEAGPAAGQRQRALMLEANVDDLDPRVWPTVLDRLLQAGASDAWLTPILMKKGRPAHTVHVLCDPASADRLRRVVFAETTTIGLRAAPVDKDALERTQAAVEVGGRSVRIKVATLDGALVNGSVEYDDVLAAAAALGRPVKAVLAEATSAAHAAGLLP